MRGCDEGGCHAQNQNTTGVVVYAPDAKSAMQEAADADAVIIFVSTTSGEGQDRTSLAYSDELNNLVTQVSGGTEN